ncbi:MAG: hypothetical protein HY042_10975 [Spirochaetia bacterium]|nr:hypothetical protein [Spirochaetia bacterium]
MRGQIPNAGHNRLILKGSHTHPAVSQFFEMPPDKKKAVQIFLCRFALQTWQEYCREKGTIEYVEMVVGSYQTVDPDLPRDALLVVTGEADPALVGSRFNEPVTALEDEDLRVPENIRYAYYSIYNLFEKYVTGRDVDDWLIVNQAVSATEDEDRWGPLVQEAVDAVNRA